LSVSRQPRVSGLLMSVRTLISVSLVNSAKVAGGLLVRLSACTQVHETRIHRSVHREESRLHITLRQSL
jgi:hypothetical protein